MASEKQLAANQANAKLSTGPKTDEGKSKTRLNAWKHGLTAEAITIAAEDPAEFEALRTQLWEEFQPAPGIECVLLDRLATRAWRLRRIPVFEAALLTIGREEVAEGRREYGWHSDLVQHEERWSVDTGLALMRGKDNRLLLLSRYEATQMNAFQRDLQQLLFLQDRRRAERERDKEVEVAPLQISKRDAAA
jgi:hypothetical protein